MSNCRSNKTPGSCVDLAVKNIDEELNSKYFWKASEQVNDPLEENYDGRLSSSPSRVPSRVLLVPSRVPHNPLHQRPQRR